MDVFRSQYAFLAPYGNYFLCFSRGVSADDVFGGGIDEPIVGGVEIDALDWRPCEGAEEGAGFVLVVGLELDHLVVAGPHVDAGHVEANISINNHTNFVHHVGEGSFGSKTAGKGEASADEDHDEVDDK